MQSAPFSGSLLNMVHVLQDGVKPIDLDATTAAHFAKADMDGDGRITFPDFLAFYSTLAASQARQELRAAFGPQAESALFFPGLSHLVPAGCICCDRSCALTEVD